ncbi:DUF4105 domain-containing protein [Pelagicoccus sp. SDUM812003]|uniref:Lnb N-terminal periplasmic domain-containing protein n=1 Tax=Pelagicoccus sp. SDUM812003 TaxID=3041267 RepID=UPI00280F8561|nr:DUF4105 domain-containing protein [Pelagicoccus sp. SDUM812003]MDQ8205654.1 DUF4105 domain-containing protein [Pelagicoccus sp. SDUM812003]
MTSSHSRLSNTGRFAAWIGLLLFLLVSLILIGQFIGLASSLCASLAVISWGVLIWICSLRFAGLIVALTAFIATIGYIAQRPSNDRDWKPEIARLPRFEIADKTLSLTNLRDFRWRSVNEYEERWVDTNYQLDELRTLDVFVVPFGPADLMAHVMLSFGFADGRRLALSVETRLEKDEHYSLIGGAARQLELIYLFGAEADLLGLRIFHRGNRVYRFPLKTTPDFARDLLLDLCASANQLHERPQFYATLRHNCTTTLLRHVDRIHPDPIGFRKEILFPAHLGELLHRLDYLDTDLDWPAAQEAFRIDERVRHSGDLTNLSDTL